MYSQTVTQRVLHVAARLITGVRRNDHNHTLRQHCGTHFTGCPCLSSQRITFKIALITSDSMRAICVRHKCCIKHEFLPRNAMQSVVLRSHVRPSLRPSVTLVDCDHIDLKSWKLISQAISPTPSLFVAKRRST